MKIIIYTSPTCPYCLMAKEFFIKNNIEFEEVDLSKNEKIASDLISRSGYIGVPIIEIGKRFVAGFDEEKIKEFLYL